MIAVKTPLFKPGRVLATPGALEALEQAGQSVSIQYDDKYVWMPRADGKQLRLTQDYSRDIFVANSQCRAAVKKTAP